MVTLSPAPGIPAPGKLPIPGCWVGNQSEWMGKEFLK